MIARVFASLESYKDQFGLIVQAALLLATFVIICVGFKQARADTAQANAADAQVVVANAQAQTARD